MVVKKSTQSLRPLSRDLIYQHLKRFRVKARNDIKIYWTFWATIIESHSTIPRLEFHHLK
jgi:hypothetical protein